MGQFLSGKGQSGVAEIRRSWNETGFYIGRKMTCGLAKRGSEESRSVQNGTERQICNSAPLK